MGVLLVGAVVGCHKPTEHEHTVAVRREQIREMRQRLERGDRLLWTDGEAIRGMCQDKDEFPELVQDCAAVVDRLPRRPSEPSAADVYREGQRKILRDAAQRLARGEKLEPNEVTPLRNVCEHDEKLRQECDAVIPRLP